MLLYEHDLPLLSLERLGFYLIDSFFAMNVDIFFSKGILG